MENNKNTTQKKHNAEKTQRRKNSIQLWRCVYRNDIAELKDLLQKDIDINFIYDDSCGDEFIPGSETPLMTAASNGNLDILKLLIEAGAKINFKVKNSWTALIHAAFNNHLDCVKMLLDKNAAVNIEVGDKDKNVLHLLLSKEDENTFKIFVMLLEHIVDINHKDKNGLSLLHHYANSKPKYIKELVLAGANLNAQDNKGQTPLMLAVISGSLENVDCLLEAGAYPHIKNKQGLTALELAKDKLKNCKDYESIEKYNTLIKLINDKILTNIFERDMQELLMLKNSVSKAIDSFGDTDVDQKEQTLFTDPDEAEYRDHTSYTKDIEECDYKSQLTYL